MRKQEKRTGMRCSLDNLLSLEVDIDHVRAHGVRTSEVRWESSKYECAGREIGECSDKERHAGAAIRSFAFSGPFGTVAPVSNRGSGVPDDPRCQSELPSRAPRSPAEHRFPSSLSLSSRSHSREPYRVTMVVCPSPCRGKLSSAIVSGSSRDGLLRGISLTHSFSFHDGF